MGYAIYLRKSRADAELELRGEGETLARHENQLVSLACKLGLDVTQIYREIVSGETIAARPEMQKLLSAVSDGIFEGVLVMEIERLARGETIDQGIVAQTFKFSGTKIITPTKTYDPANEFDQEYFEFALFMSRREYQTIKRRLQAGRMASVKEGNYIGSRPPYGYRKVRDDIKRAFSLEPIPQEAAVVRMMFDMFANQNMGYDRIATALMEMGTRPRYNTAWTSPSIRGIIGNPVYVGLLRWDYRKVQRKMVDGQIVLSRPKTPGRLFQGNHEPIIDRELWERAQMVRETRQHPSTNQFKPMTNIYAGLLFCQLCGHAMHRRPYNRTSKDPSYTCDYKGCNCVSSYQGVIDQAVTAAIESELKTQKELLVSGGSRPGTSHAAERDALNSEILKVKTQLNNLYDLVEQGIYTHELFLERSTKLNAQLEQLKKALSEVPPDVETKPPQECIVLLDSAIKQYTTASDPMDRNAALKTIIKRIEYKKTVRDRALAPSDLEISVEFLF